MPRRTRCLVLFIRCRGVSANPESFRGLHRRLTILPGRNFGEAAHESMRWIDFSEGDAMESPKALERNETARRDYSQRGEDNTLHLQLCRAAHEAAIAQRKSPRKMRRAADADAFVCDNIESRA